MTSHIRISYAILIFIALDCTGHQLEDIASITPDRTRYLKLFIMYIALLTSVLFLSKTSYAQSTVTPPSNLEMLLATIPDELKNLPYAIYPSSPNYESARFSANKRFSVYPHAIFTPQTEQEARFVLSALKKHHLAFSIRSGGHGYEGNALSSDYIFDLRNFNAIVPDVKNQTVTIGAGCRLGDVIKTLGKLDFAIPTGTCPNVGVAGLTLGGGIGLLSRTYGLTSDSVTSITLLNANSEVIEVNEHSHPDLFWALRGSGNGSYGIVLGFTFKMYYIPAVTYYELTWDWDAKKAPKIIQTWQTWFQTLPPTITSQLRIRYANGSAEMSIAGLKVNDATFDEWKTAFQPLHPKVTITTGRYGDLVKYWAETQDAPYLKTKSNIIMRPLSSKVTKKMVRFFNTLINDHSTLRVLFDFDGLGGKVPLRHSAFYPRKALTWWYQGIYWEHPEQEKEALRRSRQFYKNIQPDVSAYCYANTVDYDIGKRYLDAYYGNNVTRLLQTKRKYDPDNLFRWRQSIPLKQ